MEQLPIDIKNVIEDFSTDSNDFSMFSIDELLYIAKDKNIDVRRALYDGIKKIESDSLLSERISALVTGSTGRLVDYLYPYEVWSVYTPECAIDPRNNKVCNDVLVLCIQSRTTSIEEDIKQIYPNNRCWCTVRNGCTAIHLRLNNCTQVQSDIALLYNWKYPRKVINIDNELIFSSSFGFYTS